MAPDCACHGRQSSAALTNASRFPLPTVRKPLIHGKFPGPAMFLLCATALAENDQPVVRPEAIP